MLPPCCLACRLQALQKRLIAKTEEVVEKDLQIQASWRGGMRADWLGCCICVSMRGGQLPIWTSRCTLRFWATSKGTLLREGWPTSRSAHYLCSQLLISSPALADGLPSSCRHAHGLRTLPPDTWLPFYRVYASAASPQEKERLYLELKSILARQPGPEAAEQLNLYQVGEGEGEGRHVHQGQAHAGEQKRVEWSSRAQRTQRSSSMRHCSPLNCSFQC